MKRLILAAAIALALVASLPRGGSAAPPPKPVAPAATVSVGTATETALAPTRWVPGSVMSRDDSRIASAAAGRVVVIVEVGTAVKAGQRLAKLDDVSLRLKLEEAKAQAGRARAQRELAASQFGRLDKLAPGNAVARSCSAIWRWARDSSSWVWATALPGASLSRRPNWLAASSRCARARPAWALASSSLRRSATSSSLARRCPAFTAVPTSTISTSRPAAALAMRESSRLNQLPGTQRVGARAVSVAVPTDTVAAGA